MEENITWAPEPWEETQYGIRQKGIPGSYITRGGERKADACRIVACVNACAGIETETLESEGSIAEIIVEKNKRISELEAELADERAKVERLREAISPFTEDDCTEEIVTIGDDPEYLRCDEQGIPEDEYCATCRDRQALAATDTKES